MTKQSTARFTLAVAITLPAILCGTQPATAQEVAIGGFIPFVGIGMTNESKTLDSLDLGDIPFITDPSLAVPAGVPLLSGPGQSPFFDIGLLDTGAATHIITQAAYNGFDLEFHNLDGVNIQPIGGATGVIETVINDAAGFYAAGLTPASTDGTNYTLDRSSLRGQTSIATLTASEDWTLPNIVGLPMAAQHAIAIRNDQPQIFQHQGRTVRTPKVDFIDIGSGAEEGILRRAPLILNPGIGFIQGPQYVFNLDLDDLLGGSGSINVANNPASPSVIIDSSGNGGGLFLELDLRNGTQGFEDKQLLFDTGADLTVISEITAKRLGFDAVLDKPDFVLEVEGSGGVQGGVPGFYVDELNIDTVGGNFTLQNVPVAVFDVTNPNDPGNIIDGIIGMHLFNGRNIVIDAEASFGQGGNGPSLYISDPVTNVRTWAGDGTPPSGPWANPSAWLEGSAPDELSDVRAIATEDGAAMQQITTDLNSIAHRLKVAGANGNTMRLQIGSVRDLTVYGEVVIEEGGAISIPSGSKLDAQFVNIFGGELIGTGEVFVGTGPISAAVRNIGGLVAPGNNGLRIVGDFSNLEEGTFRTSIGETRGLLTADVLEITRNAFLSGTLDVRLDQPGSSDFGIGDAFTILTTGEAIFGEFDTLLLPQEYLWDIDYLTNSVVLEVIGFRTPGDFSGDGLVDVTDYTVWRDGYGDHYTIADYLVWKSAFAAADTAAASLSISAPEPASLLLLTLALAPICRRQRR
ncbi:MAG: retropepsin-like aspartic protease [Planctomycetota bacterium]